MSLVNDTKAGGAGRMASWLLLAVILAALIIAPRYLGRGAISDVSTWAVFSIAAIGLNLTLGYAGQVSLAQGAFVGIGAYTGALLTMGGVPVFVAMAAALLLSFALGWLLGYPALRVQHHYLAFVTLAFSTLAFLVFRNEAWLTNGIPGLTPVPRTLLFGWAVPANFAGKELNYYYFCLSTLVVVTLAVGWLVRSPWGRAFLALRENPLRAQSLGIDTRQYILMAFAIGSALGGLAGVLYGPLVGIVEPPSFTLELSLKLLLMVIVGGSGYFWGPYLGAAIAVMLPELLRALNLGKYSLDIAGRTWSLDLTHLSDFYLLIYALIVMLLLIYSPKGLFGIADDIVTARKTRAASAARASATATFTQGA